MVGGRLDSRRVQSHCVSVVGCLQRLLITVLAFHPISSVTGNDIMRAFSAYLGLWLAAGANAMEPATAMLRPMRDGVGRGGYLAV